MSGTPPGPPTATAAAPDITVIVVFHTRLQFLPLAIESVLRQDLPAARFEVLVVGPHRPPELVERSSDPKLTFVECSEVGLGNKIAAAARQATTPLVAFLEDDDLFEPNHLSRVLSSFRADPTLTYFQNGYHSIDGQGKANPQPGPPVTAMHRWSHRGLIRVPGRPLPRDLARMVGIPVGFNNSSIAVRRELLERGADLLDQVDMLVDVTLLYLALTAPGALVFDPIPITALRRHAASNSDPTTADSAEQLRRLREFQTNAQRRRESLVAFVRREGPAAVVASIVAQRDIGEVIFSLRDPGVPRSARATSLLRTLGATRSFEVRRYWTAVPLGFLSLFAPSLGTRVYIRLRRQLYGME
ncbi:MAG: glycosyltransferase [Thermoplasmata archaeon]